MMSKKIFLLFFLALVGSTLAATAQDLDIEQIAKREPALPTTATQPKNIHVFVNHDYGWVKQGSEKGRWTLTTTSFGFFGNPFLWPYFEVDLWDRLGTHDYTASAGAYLKFKDNSFLNAAVGFGGDVRYAYRFKSQLEYQHRLIHSLYWNASGRYLNYPVHDTIIFTPGLIFYFRDNDISLFYNHAITESRGGASSGILRGNFVFNNRLSFYVGAAAGERLYDINELPAADQNGYIAFAGFRFRLNDRLFLRTGFSYSTEKPSFIKRSLEIGLSAKF